MQTWQKIWLLKCLSFKTFTFKCFASQKKSPARKVVLSILSGMFQTPPTKTSILLFLKKKHRRFKGEIIEEIGGKKPTRQVPSLGKPQP